MTAATRNTCKITVSVPADLVAYADCLARQRGVSRSRVITQALAEYRAAEQERLAIEGYRFYADEACCFANDCRCAIAEAWSMSVKRGEIYWVEFDPVKGSEQGGLRPALVVQNDLGNRTSPTTVVAAITRTVPRQPYPFVVVLAPEESGLSEISAVNCSQLATVQQSGAMSRLRPPRGEVVVRPIGVVAAERMPDVEEAIRFSLGLR